MTDIKSKGLRTLAGGPSDPITGALALVQAWKEYQIVRQREKTQREAIRAQAATDLERIRAQAGLLRDYFDKVFAERRENFARGFAMLESGFANRDDRQIEAALTLIVTLVKESPIKQTAEVMRQIRNRAGDEIIDL